MKKAIVFALHILMVTALNASVRIDLSGKWQFKADPADIGIANNWQNEQFNEYVELPGSMTTNGKGNDIHMDTKWTATNWSDNSWFNRPEFAKFRTPDNLKFSFWLTPIKEYVGAAWYQKTVKIPNNWKSQKVFLHLERCHWETTVWVNGIKSGLNNSLSTAHVYQLTGLIPGRENTISIRVDNRIKDIHPGLDAHSVSDNTQTNWNGIIGDLFVESRPLVHIHTIKITPDIRKRIATAEIEIQNDSDSELKRKIRINTHSTNSDQLHTLPEKVQTLTIQKGKHLYCFAIEMGKDVQLWSEHTPVVYKMNVAIDKIKNSSAETTFGMREIRVDGTRFLINEKPVFLRGTLECAIFPLTGHPPTDVASWRKIMNKIKEFGLNHMRFHSWCPPKAAFIAADETGVYLQVEVGAWATIGDGKAIDQFIYDESERIIRDYGNHPSFCLMAHGNEPSGNNQQQYLGGFVSYWKKKDNRRVYTSGAGWPEIPENEYHNIPAPRIQHWGAGLKSSINASQPQSTSDYSSIIVSKKIPVVSHEIGQWCAFPNFEEIKKYSGVLKAKNFELFREHLTDKNMGHMAKQFHMASGKLQALCYKADIEAALRTKNMAGFQLLDLHDFPGQGTALVGVLDAFWDEKEYITAQEYRRFSNTVVPLVRLPKMVFSRADTLKAEVEVANFGGKPLLNKQISWEILAKNNQPVASGSFKPNDYPEGNGIHVGSLELPLSGFKSPESYQLRVSINNTTYHNTWDIWIYPEQLVMPDHEVFITDTFNETTIEQLQKGRNVLLSVKKNQLKPDKGGDVEFGFSSVFWNTSWTKNQAPHTLGILCDPEHPSLAHFPTEYHTNWQWWDIIHNSAAINTDQFPAGFTTLVQPIHTWFENQRLALIFEAKIGNAKIIVTGIDFGKDSESRIATRQLKYSLLEYMRSKNFNPSNELKLLDLETLYNKL